MMSTRNAVNNDQITEEQIAMFQTLQTQMEEMCQKVIEDQRRNEKEVHNKELKRWLDEIEREEQSQLGNYTHNQEKTTTTWT